MDCKLNLEPQETSRRPWAPTDVAYTSLRTSGLPALYFIVLLFFIDKLSQRLGHTQMILGYLSPCIGFSSEQKQQPYLVIML